MSRAVIRCPAAVRRKWLLRKLRRDFSNRAPCASIKIGKNGRDLSPARSSLLLVFRRAKGAASPARLSALLFSPHPFFLNGIMPLSLRCCPHTGKEALDGASMAMACFGDDCHHLRLNNVRFAFCCRTVCCVRLRGWKSGDEGPQMTQRRGKWHQPEKQSDSF